MRLNYFAAVQLAMGFLPGMAERQYGRVVNISSIGVLTSAPRFSAYVASKAALEAWSDCAASEFLDRGVAFTNVNMPLVRTRGSRRRSASITFPFSIRMKRPISSSKR
jgi:short-subunit dehydrogenase